MAQDVKILFTGSFGLDLNSGSTFEAAPFPNFGTVSPSGSITSASIASGLTLQFSDNTIGTGSLTVENGPCSGSSVYFSWILLPGATPPPTPAPVTPPPTPAPVTPAPTPAPSATPAPAAAPTTPSPVAPPPVTPAPAASPVTPSPTPAPAVTPAPTNAPTNAPTPAPTNAPTPAPVTPSPTPAPAAPPTPAPTAPCFGISVSYNSGYPYGCCGPGAGDSAGTFYFNAANVGAATRMYTSSGCSTLTSGPYYVSYDTSEYYLFVNGVKVGGVNYCSGIDCEEV